MIMHPLRVEPARPLDQPVDAVLGPQPVRRSQRREHPHAGLARKVLCQRVSGRPAAATPAAAERKRRDLGSMGAIKVAPDPAPPAKAPAAPPPGANAEQQAEMDQAAAAAAPPDAPMGYQPTEAQLAAAQKVNAEQDARAAAAEALPEETKRKRYRVDSDRGINEEADDFL